MLSSHVLKNNAKGFSILEVILSCALFAFLAVGLATTVVFSQQSAKTAETRLKAAFLAEEGIAALTNIRDESYENLQDGAFGLRLNNNIWELSENSDSTDIFTRTVNISSNSTSSKDVTVTVQANPNLSREVRVTLFSRLTNWKNN